MRLTRGLTIRNVLYLMLMIVTFYCGYNNIQLELYFKSSTVSNLTVTKEISPILLSPEVHWGTDYERQLNTESFVQNSSAIHKKLIGTHVVEKVQQTVHVSSQDVSDASKITELSSKESQHITYSTEKSATLSTMPKQQPDLDQGLGGYILPFSVYEEQTNGAKNLWQLQIWANLVKMHVVEPFAKDSVFTMNGVAPNFSGALRFGDYFDLEKWNEMVAKTHGSPLVKWEEFIAKSPRDVIILYTTKGDFTEPLTVVYDDDVNQYMNNKRLVIPKSDLEWIHKNFNVIKRVCYLSSVNKPHPLTIAKFKSMIFGDLSPNNTSLIIAGWEGIRNSRVHITPIYIFMTVFSPDIIFLPSKRILNAYKSYITQYVGNRRYVGIVFRSHHIYFWNQYSKEHNYTAMNLTLLQCSKQLKQQLDKIRKRQEIFLAIDLGTFGDKNMMGKLIPLKNQIHLDVFNGSLTAEQREERLINAAGGITDRGFIAQLEKVIATNANCIIVLGKRSGFVLTSISLYLENHPVDRCIVNICYGPVFDKDHVLLSSSHIPKKFI